MHVRLCIILLFFCCALMQACEKKEIEYETIFDFQVRAQKYREKSKQWYAANRWIKQAALLKKLTRNFSDEDKKTPLVFAKRIDEDN
ncbi:MAG: hypothetical protein Q8Q60_01450 [Candidatus Chromulinivorax sp.]|nr:hypothetical protein [Candidatus Chromulinivorax sp.]